MNPAQAYNVLLQLSEPNVQHSNATGAKAVEAGQALRPLIDAWIEGEKSRQAGAEEEPEGEATSDDQSED